VRANEERVFAYGRNATEQSLDEPVVDRDAAVIEVARERIVVAQDVAGRDRERGCGWSCFVDVRAPAFELRPDRAGARAAAFGESIAAQTLRLDEEALDGVDLLEGGDRDRRAHVAGIERLDEVAASVHRAAALDQLLPSE